MLSECSAPRKVLTFTPIMDAYWRQPSLTRRVAGAAHEYYSLSRGERPDFASPKTSEVSRVGLPTCRTRHECHNLHAGKGLRESPRVSFRENTRIPWESRRPIACQFAQCRV